MIDALIFVLLQGLAINGFYASMDDGMIFNWYRVWLKKMPDWIGKPFGLCVRCMASTGSIVTFWPYVLHRYGWHPAEVGAWAMDAFILVTINFYIYKKV